MKSIAVFCGSSNGNSPFIVEVAHQIGKYLAEHNISLVYGGSKIGLMGTVAQAALDANGSIIGVIPEFLKTKEIVNLDISELVVTKNMHERKVIMYERSDAFMIIPGGFGTMDEFFEITTWGQLGLHSKPIGILNVGGYYDALLSQFQVMVDHQLLSVENLSAVLVDDTIEGLITKMNNYIPLPKPKWLNVEGL
ncbi:MAG: TIGR00730 family Rossman fold protein [Winogradskyella sp.]|nr:TIGR00730 family Rossman fold protein [Winogradskyella sp.]